MSLPPFDFTIRLAYTRITPLLMREITSPQNPQIKLAGKLRRKRHRQTHGLIFLEGARLVQDALTAGVELRCCFVTGGFIDSAPGLIARLEEVCPVYRTAENLFRNLTETVSPQGIAAIAALPQLPLPAQNSLALVLDGVGDPGNAGTLLRTAAAAGVALVLFGPGSVDPFNDKVLRAGMGAHFRVPLRVADDWQALRGLLPAESPVYVADVGGSVQYDAIDWRQPAVLVVGSEAHGPSQQALAAGQAVAIPMAAATESLNAAAAGAVILFEAARQRRHTQSAPF